MPRLSKSEKERIGSHVSGTIAKYCECTKTTKGEFLSNVGITRSTYSNRRNNPSSWTLGELLNVANKINISVSTLLGGE